MPLAAVITPATAPCSASGTAKDAPAVKPGRVKPNPSEATAKQLRELHIRLAVPEAKKVVADAPLVEVKDAS